MKKIAVATGTRAEYGLLKPLIEIIHQDKEATLQLYVTAMHLSPEFGMTVREIQNDGYPICKKIEVLLSSDTGVSILKSMSLTQISFAEAFAELQPDILIILGDRTEMLSISIAAYILRIPIAHLYGGETTEGNYDEAIRHSITKMSYWHFTSTETYKNRVIQLGESPERVFNVGAIAIDSIKNISLLSKIDFEKCIDFRLGKINFLVTYHPVTLENLTAANQFKQLLKALDIFKDAYIIFTKPNSDKEGRVIIKMIDEYVLEHPNKSIAFNSLGQLRYLSALQYVDAVIGNSSSGLVEVPAFNIPTVNIGDRQKGRYAPKSVIHCTNDKNQIIQAIKKSLSDEFKKSIKDMKNPYGSGNTAKKIIQVLKSVKSINLKKKFYDLPQIIKR